MILNCTSGTSECTTGIYIIEGLLALCVCCERQPCTVQPSQAYGNQGRWISRTSRVLVLVLVVIKESAGERSFRVVIKESAGEHSFRERRAPLRASPSAIGPNYRCHACVKTTPVSSTHKRQEQMGMRAPP